MIKNKNRSNIIKLFVGLFFVVSVLYPLLQVLLSIGEVDIGRMLQSAQFTEALRNSLMTSVTATVIAVTLSFLLSWSILRTAIKHKTIFSVLLTLPMLIPSISHGMGLIILFGTNGIVTNFFNSSVNIYGFWGIVIGSVLYSFPVSFLMISDSLMYEDSSPYEAADILGFSSWHKFKSITVPYLRKPMIAVIFANFTMIVTDYGVPLMIGGKYTTLPVLMYQEVIGRLDFNKGAVIGVVLLVPAFIAFILDLMNKDKGNTSFIVKGFDIKGRKLRDRFAYSFIGLVIFLVALPIMVFILLTFSTNYPVNLAFTLENVTSTLTASARGYLMNSLVISVGVALLGTVLAYITAYLTVRMPSSLSTGLHLIAVSSLAIPGLVLGLAYVMTFNQTAIYGTIGILILVNLVHFFASPYLMIYNTLGKVNENLESIGQTLGIGRLRMIKDIIIPQTKGTILEMLSYFFVNSMITISAVSFLATINNKPVSLLINEFEGNMLIEASAFISLIILIINLIMKFVVYLVKNKMNKRIGVNDN